MKGSVSQNWVLSVQTVSVCVCLCLCVLLVTCHVLKHTAQAVSELKTHVEGRLAVFRRSTSASPILTLSITRPHLHHANLMFCYEPLRFTPVGFVCFLSDLLTRYPDESSLACAVLPGVSVCPVKACGRDSRDACTIPEH